MRISDWSSDVCSSDLRTLRSPPLLVIPVYSVAGIPQVFEQRSEWQRAWAEYHTGQSAIDYVRTAGTGVDTLLPNAGQTGRRGRVWWRVILHRSEERRVGRACVRTGRARWQPEHSKKTPNIHNQQ